MQVGRRATAGGFVEEEPTRFADGLDVGCDRKDRVNE